MTNILTKKIQLPNGDTPINFECALEKMLTTKNITTKDIIEEIIHLVKLYDTTTVINDGFFQK